MTDQLTTLLRREADELLIPVAPVDDVMSAGRTARRRRRTSHVLTAAAAVALVGAGITTIQHRGSASTFEPVSPAAIRLSRPRHRVRPQYQVRETAYTIASSRLPC